MADEKIKIGIEIDGADGLKDLTNESKKASKATKDLSGEMKSLDSRFEDVYGDLQPMTTRLGEMEDRMYELANAGQANTKEFQLLQKEATKFRKTIKQVDMAVDSAAEGGRNLNTALALSSSVVAGYQGFASVTALVGDENEELMETMVKLQAAEGALQSIQTVRYTLQQNQLALTRAQSVAQGMYTAVVGTSTGALKAFRIAMVATGIGAIIVGIGLLVANWESFVGVIKASVEWVKDFANAVIGFLVPGYAEMIEAQEEAEAQAEAERRKQEELIEAQKRKVAALLDAYEKEKELNDQKIHAIDFEIRKRQAAGKATGEIEIEKLKVMVEATKREMELRKQAADAFVQQLEMQNNHLLNFAKTHGITTDQIIDNLGKVDEEYKKMEDDLQKTLEDIEVMEIKQATQRNENAQKAIDERKKMEEGFQDFMKKLREESMELNGQDMELELMQIREQAQERLAFIDETNLSEIEKEKAKQLVMQNLKLKTEDVTQDAIMQTKEAEISASKEVVGVKKKAADEKMGFDQEAAQFAISQTASMFGTIASAFEQGSATQKSFALASIIADTAEALMKAVPVALEASKETGPAAPFVFGGTLAGIIGTVVGAAANAKQVLSSAPGPASGGGGGTVSTPQVGSNIQSRSEEPSVNLFGQGNEGSEGGGDQFTAGTPNQGGGAFKAYVVQSEIQAVDESNTALLSESQM